MKTVTYKCDNEDCGKQTEFLQTNEWIEIGSEDDKLFINNFIRDAKLVSANNFSSMHFCSKSCLLNRLFL